MEGEIQDNIKSSESLVVNESVQTILHVISQFF